MSEESKAHSEQQLHDFIDMEAYDVVAGETHRRLVEQLEAQEEKLLAALAAVYRDTPAPGTGVVIARLCDDHLDRSGRLLGRVRNRASSPASGQT